MLCTEHAEELALRHRPMGIGSGCASRLRKGGKIDMGAQIGTPGGCQRVNRPMVGEARKVVPARLGK